MLVIRYHQRCGFLLAIMTWWQLVHIDGTSVLELKSRSVFKWVQ